MTQRIYCTALLSLGVIALHCAARPCPGAAAPPRTLAVLSCDAGQSSELVAQVTGKLSGDPTVKLVERDQLNRLVQEQTLSAALSATATRVQIGRLVGADALALLSIDNGPDGAGTRLLVCDSATGSRLAQLRVSDAGAKADVLADEIRAALARFPDGVKSVVAVSDLISRDLRLDYSSLQSTLSDVLRDALSRQPGVAVLEIDEARAIANEQEQIRGGEVRRLVPLFVEGEFRTDPLAKGGPRIAISINLKNVERELMNLKSGDIAMDDAGKFIGGDILRKVLESLSPSGAQIDASGAADPAKQFDRLIARANLFAEIGEFERSAALREAALLVKPEADDERVKLVREYARWNRRPVEVWPKAKQATPTNAGPATRPLESPFWLHVVARCRESWRRSLRHVEYLVRNRRVDLKTGTELYDAAVHSITGIRVTMSSTLGEEEAIKKDFVRNVAPALLALDPGKERPPAVQGRSSAAYRIYESCFFRVDGNFLKEEDLKLTGDLLCELLPADTPVAPAMLYRLRDGTRMFGRGDRDVSADTWKQFADRLIRSPRPLVNAYGRYARLCDQRYREEAKSPELLKEANSLVDAVASQPIASLDPGGFFLTAARDEVGWLKQAMNIDQPRAQPAAPVVRNKADEAHPVQAGDGALQCERVRLEPIQLQLTSKTQKPRPIRGQRWRGAGGFGGWSELVPAWDGIDVIYASGAVLFVSANGTAREVLVDEKLSIFSVVFDGKYVWASGGYNRGIYAIDRAGTIVAHATAAEGLPDSYVVMPLLALAEGRVMAAGSIGQAARGWIATIELAAADDGKPRVKVIHEAVKAWQYQDTPFQQVMDPAMRFQPDWIIEHRDEEGKRWAFVDRRQVPLMVNLQTMEVLVYPIRKRFEQDFPRVDGPHNAFLSRDGLLYVAGSMNDFKAFRLDVQTHLFKEALPRETREWHSGNDTAGCVTESDGYIYYCGQQRWGRYHLGDGREDLLVTNPRSLPAYGSGGRWRMANSRCFGLVAWVEGNLYRCRVEDAATTKPAGK